jgi:hypothetical protein
MTRGTTVSAISRIACIAIAVTGLFAVPVAASAEDSIYPLSIPRAMATRPALQKLDGTVRFYFGHAPHLAIQHTFGEFETNKKTNSLFKPNDEACSWVFLSAMLELQKRARILGANAIVNIRSDYDKNEVWSDTDIECHVGGIMDGIALKGEFVTVTK